MGWNWAHQNDEPVHTYPPKRGERRIGQRDFHDVISIFEHEVLLALLEKQTTAFIQLGASSGKDIAYFARTYSAPQFYYSDIAPGAKEYAEKTYSSSKYKIVFSSHEATEIHEVIDQIDDNMTDVVILIKGMANYILPEDIDKFFGQFSTSKYNIHLFILDQNKEDKMSGDIVFGRMRYGSYSHNYKELAEASGFESENWNIWPSKETGGSDTRLFAYFTMLKNTERTTGT